MTEKEKLEVEIFGKKYSLLVQDKEVAEDLVKYVDKVMNEVKEDLKDQPTETIAIIAALNIAYDLSMEKNKFKEFGIQATDKIKQIKLQIEKSRLFSTPS